MPSDEPANVRTTITTKTVSMPRTSPLRVVEHPEEAWCDAEHAKHEPPAVITEEIESPSILESPSMLQFS